MKTARNMIDKAQRMVNDLREHPKALPPYRARLEEIVAEIADLHAEIMEKLKKPAR
jgi:hypothetical protein